MDHGKKITKNIFELNFISGLPKSGTSLLMTLLDSHPGLLVYPVESRFLAQQQAFAKMNNSHEEVIDYIVTKSGFATFNPDSNKFKKESNAQPKEYLHALSFEHFKKELASLLKTCRYPLSLQDLFYVTAEAYKYARELNITYNAPIVEKTPGNEFHLQTIKINFPDAKILYVLRHPVSNLASYLRYQKKRSGELDFGFYLRSLRSARVARKREGSDDFIILKYEDLTTKTESVMGDVAKTLGVTYSDSMLYPTIAGGIPWSGNSSVGEKYKNEVSDSRVDSYKSELSRDELVIYEFMYGFGSHMIGDFLISLYRIKFGLVEKAKITVMYCYAVMFMQKERNFLQQKYE